MQAKIQVESDIYIIYLIGQLNYETATPFRDTCLNHLYKEKVVFNCKELSFVGSKGITDFLETLVSLSEKAFQPVRFCNVVSEFRRIFETSDIKNLQIFEEESLAKKSFHQAVQALPRLEATENYLIDSASAVSAVSVKLS